MDFNESEEEFDLESCGLSESLKEKIGKHGINLAGHGIWEFGWSKEHLIEFIESIMEEEVSLSGGDVYRLENDYLCPLYDNWYCERQSGESDQDFSLRSKQEALRYVKKYPSYPGNGILFTLVFSNTGGDNAWDW